MPEPKPLAHETRYGEQIIAGEPSLVIRPRYVPNAASRLIVSYHGATGNELAVGPLAFGQGASYRYLAHLAGHNFTVVSSLMGGDLWGKPEGDAHTDTILAWATAQGIDTTKFGVFGGSGGTFPSMNYWRRHRDKVGAVFLTVPAVHLSHTYDDNPTLRAQMDATFAGDAKVNGQAYSPIEWAEELAGPEPVMVAWADDDVAIRDADVTAFAAAAAAEIVVNTATGGHGDLGDYDVDVADMVRVYEALRS